jgi:hypothetical protein
MRATILRLLAALSVLAVLLVTRPASALEPAYTAGSTQFSGGLRFGTDNMNVGLGIRGGHTLDNNLYLGGAFDYFFGESNDYVATVPGHVVVVNNNGSVHYWTLSFEGGYDFHIVERLVIRPFGGLGIIDGFGRDCAGNGCYTYGNTHALFTLGGLVSYFVAEKIFVGGETRLLIFDTAEFVLGGHVGFAF